MSVSTQTRYLLVTIGARLCAFPLANVVETMRPLKTIELPSAPAFVAGVATVRGALTLVVNGGVLLAQEQPPARMVILRSSENTFGITVGGVAGIVDLDDESDDNLSPLLPNITAEYVEKLVKLDASFATVLDSGRIVPESVWQALKQMRGEA